MRKSWESDLVDRHVFNSGGGTYECIALAVKYCAARFL